MGARRNPTLAVVGNPQGPEAYRGYLMHEDFAGDWHVSKGGHHISTQGTREAARAVVRELTQDNPRRRTMSRAVRAIEYVHADDGELYRHDFEDGVGMRLTRDGRAVEIRAPGGTVADFDGQPFLVNPGEPMATKRRKPPGRYKSWAAWSRAMRARKRKGSKTGGGGTRRRRKKARRRNAPAAAAPNPARKKKGSTMAKRRRRRAPARRRRRRNPPAVRRRRARRNPPRLVKRLTDGVVGAGQIIIGRVAVRVVPDLVNLPKEGAVGLAAQAGVALLIGLAGGRVLGARAGELILAGALTAPLETAIVSANIPFVSAALEPTSLGLYPHVGSYPRVGAGVGSYPQVRPGNGMGAYPQVDTSDAITMQQ